MNRYNLLKYVVVPALTTLLLGACASPSSLLPTPTPYPTHTPYPTYTPFAVVTTMSRTTPTAIPPTLAPPTDLGAMVKAMADAFNAGNVEAVVAFYADDALRTMEPPPTGPAGGWVGKEQIRGVVKGWIDDHFSVEISNLEVAGDKATYTCTYSKLGVIPLVVIEEVVFEGRKIKSQKVTITPESLAKHQAAMAEAQAYAATATAIRLSTPTKAPSTGNIHGVIRYRCNDQPVFSYAYAVVFRSGSRFALRKVEADKNGEVLFKDLEPGLYDVYESSTPGEVFTYGTGWDVEVEPGKTKEITMYLIDCPLLRLVSPVDSEVITTTKPEFRWENYRSGSWYQVHIDGKIGKVDGATLEKTQKTSSFYSGDLEYGETYKWYVCVLKDSGSGNSVCSITSTFKVSKP